MFIGKSKFYHAEGTVSTSKTFKEKLTEKADALELDVKDHMATIKTRMDEVVSYRKFSISLWKPKPGSCIAIGNGGTTNYSAFIPYGIEEWVYVRAFRVALEELGFDNIETELTTDNSTYDCYTLKVKW
jgi:hypothetical protein